MKLYIDSREKERIAVAEEWGNASGLNPEVIQLDTGDYVFVDKDKSCAFEYKRIADFIQSVVNGKVFRQVSEMRQSYSHEFVFISEFWRVELALKEHNEHAKKTMYLKNVYAAIARLNTISHVIVMDSYNIEKDLEFMQIQATKCFNEKNYGVFEDKKKEENPAVNYISCIKGVGLKKAKALCNEFNCTSLIHLLGLTKRMVVKVDGIGDKTADKIMEAIHGGFSNE